MVTGISGKLKAAHIWPWAQSKHPSLAKLKILETDIDSPQNGLLLLATIEAAFDRKDICFLYNPFKVSESFNGKFMLRVLNPALVTQKCVPGGGTFGDLDGKAFLNLPGILLILPHLISVKLNYLAQMENFCSAGYSTRMHGHLTGMPCWQGGFPETHYRQVNLILIYVVGCY